jgi:RluA family pseudouridine synthase
MDIKPTILFEDEILLVVNKPSGLMVEPDRNGHPNLLAEVKKYLKEKTGIETYAQHLHRLDRPVSGIVLFTKSREHLRNLSEQFAERKVRKYYKALTSNEPELPDGDLSHWHRKEKKKAVLYTDPIEFTEQAKLHYKTKRLPNQLIEWDIQLETGKYHQIRAQLANLNCPILGDQLYGGTKNYLPNHIALHAYQLEFQHPVSKEQLVMQCPVRWAIT